MSPRDGQPSSRELVKLVKKARPSIDDEIGLDPRKNGGPSVNGKPREVWFGGSKGSINGILCQMTVEERLKLFDFLDERYCLDCGSMINQERPDECPKCGEI